MNKNILKKFAGFFIFGLVLFGFNFNRAFADTAPVITMLGSSPMNVIVGTVFTDPGATAKDDVDPTVTVTSSGTVDSNTIGTYTIIYTATDTSQNTTTTSRSVNIIPVPSPTLSKISITTPANKLSYFVGDALDITGLVVTGEYSDTTTKNEVITSDNITGFDGTKAISDQVLTVTVGSRTVTYNVSIKEKEIISTPPPSPVVISKDVVLKDGCTVRDTTGVEHIFPEENSVSKFLGICALAAAKENGSISNFELINSPSLGLYVKSINGIVPKSTEYWALWLNGGYADCGLGCLPVKEGDTLSLVLSDWMANTESTKILLHIASLYSASGRQNTSIGGSGSSEDSNKDKIFSTENALNFLSKYKTNSPFYMDWVAMAAGAGNNLDLKSNVLTYLKSNPIDSKVITDYERRAMALMALGINPYSDTDINYISKITSSFDGTQIGDKELFNDDIFAVTVLTNAGYGKSDEVVSKTVLFIMSKQSENGSWGSVDMTAAAVLALSNYKDLNGVSDSMLIGENYLKGQQKEDGSFGNASSTSWAVQALSLNNSYSSEVDKGIKYLASMQDVDGGLEKDNNIDNRVWVTSYAVPAALKLPWNNILKSFPKQANEIVTGNAKKVTLTKIPKREKNIINKIHPEFTLSEASPDNQSITSPVVSDQRLDNSFSGLANRVLRKISQPFVWFWAQI